MSLAMFAEGEYRGAALEAHAAAAMGPVSDWDTLYGYYGDDTVYTKQLRAVEKYAKENPKSAEPRFLLAYHYLMAGHTGAAVEQLTDVTKLAPNDKLAAEMLKKLTATDAPAVNSTLPPPLPTPVLPTPARPDGASAPGSGGLRPIDGQSLGGFDS